MKNIKSIVLIVLSLFVIVVSFFDNIANTIFYVQQICLLMIIGIVVFDLLQFIDKRITKKYDIKTKWLNTLHIFKVIIFTGIVVTIASLQFTYVKLNTEYYQTYHQFYDQYHHLIFSSYTGIQDYQPSYVNQTDNELEVIFEYTIDKNKNEFSPLNIQDYDINRMVTKYSYEIKLTYDGTKIAQHEVVKTTKMIFYADDVVLGQVDKYIYTGDYSQSDQGYFEFSEGHKGSSILMMSIEEIEQYDLDSLVIDETNTRTTIYHLVDDSETTESITKHMYKQTDGVDDELSYDIILDKNNSDTSKVYQFNRYIETVKIETVDLRMNQNAINKEIIYELGSTRIEETSRFEINEFGNIMNHYDATGMIQNDIDSRFVYSSELIKNEPNQKLYRIVKADPTILGIINYQSVVKESYGYSIRESILRDVSFFDSIFNKDEVFTYDHAASYLDVTVYEYQLGYFDGSSIFYTNRTVPSEQQFQLPPYLE